MTTITINHARKESPALAFWAEDTSLVYALPISADVAHMIAGNMGFPSKMPGTAYGISAHRCITGSKLVALLGTTCHNCYALKGNYVYSDVVRAHEIRFAGLQHARWAECMAFLLNAMHGVTPRPKRLKSKKVKSKGWHRWHDSGDLQNVAHLAAICRVCELTPSIRHWLPTRELAMVLAYVKSGGVVPDNLMVRVSATKVDGKATTQWQWTSGVHDKLAPVESERCTAPDTNGECASCRKCWSHDHKHTTYHLH